MDYSPGERKLGQPPGVTGHHRRVRYALKLEGAVTNYNSAAVLGRDRTGLLYTSQLGAFAVELVVQVQKGRTRGDQKLDTPEFQRSYALACWTAFLVQTYVYVFIEIFVS